MSLSKCSRSHNNSSSHLLLPPNTRTHARYKPFVILFICQIYPVTVTTLVLKILLHINDHDIILTWFLIDLKQVCGTDGVTYESTCHLRSQSANAQVDYRGACIDDEGSRPWELCRKIRNERNLCEDTKDRCTRRVLPKDGCCPICGMTMSL